MCFFVVYIFSPIQYLFVSFAHCLVGFFFLTVKFDEFLIYTKILYDPPPRIVEIKAEINKGDLIKLKALAWQREL